MRGYWIAAVENENGIFFRPTVLAKVCSVFGIIQRRGQEFEFETHRMNQVKQVCHWISVLCPPANEQSIDLPAKKIDWKWRLRKVSRDEKVASKWLVDNYEVFSVYA